MRRQRRTLEEAEANLTPLIDIVFVILILFIVIAPLLQIDEVALADGGAHKERMAASDSSPVCIHVLKDNTIRYNQKTLSMRQLQEQLKVAKRLHPSCIPQLLQDKEAHFGTYQNVKNSVEAAGFAKLDVLVKPQ